LLERTICSYKAGFVFTFVGETSAKKSKSKKKEERVKEEASSVFQRRRVDGLLDLLTRKFPPKIPQAPTPALTTNSNSTG
jgi:hypothetical protein